MTSTWRQRFRQEWFDWSAVGFWSARVHFIVVLLAWLLCVAWMVGLNLILQTQIGLQQGQLIQTSVDKNLATEMLQQQQTQLLVQLEHQRILNTLLVQLNQHAVEAPSVTHFMAALRHSASADGWQQVAINHDITEETGALEVMATLPALSLSNFWSMLWATGNLFDIRLLQLRRSESSALWAVRLQLVPLRAGILPETTRCLESDCRNPSAVPIQQHKGFLLRAQNNQQALTRLAVDGKGRVSAVGQTRHKEVRSEQND